MSQRWTKLHYRLCYAILGQSHNARLRLINRWYDWAYRTIGGEA